MCYAASMFVCRRISSLLSLVFPSALALSIRVLLAVGLLAHSAWSQEIMPHRPLVPGFGSLCDGGPVVCTRIDAFAFNARADAILLPSTDRRGLGFVAPYGFSIGLFERLEGGIYTSTSVWGQETAPGESSRRWQQGPMRFLAKGLLWPWAKDPHQRFTALLNFEYEARLPRFDGPNQLGLLTDLGVLRGVVNWPLGLAEVGLSAGALFDWQGRYGTAELGGHVALHLPFMVDTKVFLEGVARGFVSRMNTDAPLSGALDPMRPIVPGGAIGLGLVSRPRRQVAFAMVAQAGFGDVAPFFLTLRFADIAWGKGYPYPQSLVVDILREVGEYIAEQIRKLPEEAHETCILYDRAGQPLATLGKRTPDGAYCEWEGHRFRLGDNLYPDPERGRICLDPQAAHCVAAASQTAHAPLQPEMPSMPGATSASSPGQMTYRPLEPVTPQAGQPLSKAQLEALARHQGALGPLPRVPGQLGPDCKLYEGERFVSAVGRPSADGKHCEIDRVVRTHRGKQVRSEVKTERIPVGHAVYRDPQTGWVCTRANARGRRDCPVALHPDLNRPATDTEHARYAFSEGGRDKAAGAVKLAQKAADVLTDPAKLSTFAARTEEGARQVAQKAAEAARDPHKALEAAGDFIEGAGRGIDKGIKDFGALPRGRKIDKVFHFLGGAAVETAATAGAGAVVGGALRTGETALEVADDVRKLEKAALKGEKAAHLADNAADAGSKALDKARTGRGKNHFRPDEKAEGPHTVFKRSPDSSKVTGYETYQPNPYPGNKHDWASAKRFDGEGKSHFNKAEQRWVETPHVADKKTPGSVRKPNADELPRGYQND